MSQDAIQNVRATQALRADNDTRSMTLNRVSSSLMSFRVVTSRHGLGRWYRHTNRCYQATHLFESR